MMNLEELFCAEYAQLKKENEELKNSIVDLNSRYENELAFNRLIEKRFSISGSESKYIKFDSPWEEYDKDTYEKIVDKFNLKEEKE